MKFKSNFRWRKPHRGELQRFSPRPDLALPQGVAQDGARASRVSLWALKSSRTDPEECAGCRLLPPRSRTRSQTVGISPTTHGAERGRLRRRPGRARRRARR